MNEIPRLLEIVRQVSRQRALSRKTENAYINHIRRFQDFYAECDLTKVDADGINDFLTHLQQTGNLAVSTRNQALSALSFLYRDVFGQELAQCLKTVRHTKPAENLPAVFSSREAWAVLSKMRGDTLLVAALMYGSGLRLSEAVALRVGDIDFEQREITVRNPQTGMRDRITMLPEKIVPTLKKHLTNVKFLHEDDRLLGYGKVSLPEAIEKKYPNAGDEWLWQFAFPSHNLTLGKPAHRHHLAESTVQKAVGEAILKANIIKPACCQTFRYSFAARLFERNYDIRRIQTLLGHKNLKTTAVYRQFSRRSNANILRSPLDT
jgi:integron integrase